VFGNGAKAGSGVAGPLQGREALGPRGLLFHDLGAQINAVFADVDTRWTGDESAVPVRFLPPTEGANRIMIMGRARRASVNHHSLRPSHAGKTNRRPTVHSPTAVSARGSPANVKSI
jgi:hypothetical protein